MSDTDTIDPAPKRGWPKGKPRGQRPEQRAPQRQSGRTRAGRVKISDDPYYIDPATIPDGMAYQWNRKTYVGKEDRRNMVAMAMNGWQSVDGAERPEFGVASGEIEINGLVLQQRPREMTEEAVAEDRENARSQVRGQLNRLQDTGDGQLPRKTKDHNLYSVKRGEPIPVRNDNEYEYDGTE